MQQPYNKHQTAMNNSAPNPAAMRPAGYAFVLDEASAEKAGDMPFINETGEVAATITRVEYRRNETGSHAVLVRFMDDEEKRGTVSLTYLQADGQTPVFGANFINAMLYLMGLPGFSWGVGVNDQGQQVQVAQEFTGQRIGLVVEAVQNQNNQGSHLELRQVFDVASRCTASEAKNGEAAEAVDKLLKRLMA